MSAISPASFVSAADQLVSPYRLLAVMANHWFRRFRDHFGFPNNYTTIDLETSGLSQDNDLICTAGAVQVRDGQVADTKHWVFNWPATDIVDNSWLRSRLRDVRDAMARRNQPFHHSFEYLSTGRDPLACLTEILALVEAAEENREIIVAHNGWWFDVEFLQAHFHNYLRIPYVFPDDGVYDSGICEKASQLAEHYQPLPLADESLKAFSQRIGNIRARGVMWALGGYCDEKYQLTGKAGIRKAELHTADKDALLLHYLVQEHRRLAGMVADGQAIDNQGS